MDLRAWVQLTRGTLELAVELEAKSGEVVAVLGPNGAGKTTLLRCLAGLHPIDEGHVTLGDVVLDEPATDTFLAAEDRPVGVVFQDYLLFDHLSALDNVAFGLRARRVARGEARRRAMVWLERFGLADHAALRPAALSGGQQQRVALARALATDPQLLLLDEPLAALDAATRVSVRRDLREHLRAFDGIRILVTHDPLDAYALADRVAILEAGRITQIGTISEIAARPLSRYVAQLIGTNLVTGTIRDGKFTTADGFTLTVDPDLVGDAYASVAPSAIALYRSRPDGSPRNVWRAAITDVDHAFDRVRVRLGGPVPLVAELTTMGLAALERLPGDEVWVSIKATEINTYPR
jgi:molybdate transport system ATP-binding protein